ncbi:MAG: triple tyrosine motif-containing protein [Balneola sp.]
MKILFLFALSFFLIEGPLYSQSVPIYQYYSEDDHDAHQQNWDAVQDTNGYIYISNGEGVLKYDGKNWKHIHIGNTGRSTSLFVSSKGHIFANGQYDFGFLEPDSLNQLAFRSISDAENVLNAIFEVYEIDGKIYSRGIDRFFIYSDGILETYPSTHGDLKGSFKYGTSELIVLSNSGLLSFSEGKYQILKGSEYLGNDILKFGFSIGDNEYLLGMRNHLLLKFRNNRFEKFETEIDDELKKNQIYDGIKLGDQYVIATLLGGIYFIDLEGNLINKIDEESGLITNSVYDLFIDEEENLWVSLANGIQKFNYGSNLRKFELGGAEREVILDVKASEENAFIKTFTNIFRLKDGSYESLSLPFEIKNTQLYMHRDTLYILPFSGGVYTWTENEKLKKKWDSTERFTPIETNDYNKDPSFFSTNRILTLGSKENKVENIDHQLIFSKAVKVFENIFFLEREKGVYKYSNGDLKKIEISDAKFSEQKIIFNDISVNSSTIFLGVEGMDGMSGLFELDSDKEIFKRSKFLAEQDKELSQKQVFLIENCPSGSIWFGNDRKIKYASKVENNFSISNSPFQIIGEDDDIYSISCTNKGVWFGGVNGVYYLDNDEWNYEKSFKTNITGVFIQNDSLIYGSLGEPVKPIILPYKDNELRFSYAAASYIDETRNTYQVKLEGFDNSWSSWSSETQKDYTNIPEGTYTFKVRSQNVYEHEGIPDEFAFTILPPWYRTWWAYSLYVIMIAGMLYGIYKIRINQILKIQGVRNRIADDLHDDLSGTLIGISNFAKAITKNPDKDTRERFIGLIEKSADEAKEKISDIVWTINPTHDEWTNFLTKCRRHASDIFEAQDIEYALEMDESIPGQLEMELRKNLWLIFKEIITNIIKHADAEYVLIRFTTESGKLSITIRDKGKGFDINALKSGNGITNITKRVETIGGTVNLESKISDGTKWNIEIPL